MLGGLLAAPNAHALRLKFDYDVPPATGAAASTAQKRSPQAGPVGNIPQVQLRLIPARELALPAPAERDQPGERGKRLDSHTAAAIKDTTNQIDSNELAEVLWDIEVNRVITEKVDLYLTDTAGHVYATKEQLERLRLLVPQATGISYNGKQYIRLDAIPDIAYEIDESQQRLRIDAAATAFQQTALTARYLQPIAITQSPPGAFLNYDVLLEHQDIDNGTVANGAFEVGLFNDTGVATTTFLAREFNRDNEFVRLNSTWSRDWPDTMRTLRLGDSISAAGGWGRPVQFGGMQFGTNFATRPDFVTFPLPELQGEAVLPATVELYADDMLRLRRDIEPGPFDITNVPLTTGASDIQLVVRDVLGRERVISQPYYISRELLREGLHDYSYEAGFTRRRFSLVSNDYGRFFAAGTHRYGLSNRVSGEARLELLDEQQTLGISSSLLASRWLGTLFAAAAVSRGETGKGELLSAGLDRLGRRFSYGFQTTWTSEDFRQLGFQPGEPSPRLSTTARMGLSLDGRSSLSLAYLLLERRNDNDFEFANLNYSFRLFTQNYLNVFISRNLQRGSTFFGVNLIVPLDGDVSTSAGYRRDDGDSYTTLSFQKNLPAGNGIGYRLDTEQGPIDRHRAAVAAATTVGTYRVEAARSGSVNGLRLNASGGVAWMGSRPYLSRTLQDSFAVVEVADYENVRVYRENHEIGRTGADGTILIPRLRSFESNRLQIEQEDMPLDARIDGLEEIVAPAFRRGIHVPFPVRPANGALIELRQADDALVPAGARVRIQDQQQTFPVGRQGQVYVTGLAEINRLIAEWNGHSCYFDLKYPESAEPLPHIGPIECYEDN